MSMNITIDNIPDQFKSECPVLHTTTKLTFRILELAQKNWREALNLYIEEMFRVPQSSCVKTKYYTSPDWFYYEEIISKFKELEQYCIENKIVLRFGMI